MPTLNLYRNALLAAEDSSLIVWPEVAIPAVMNQVSSYIEVLQRDLGRRGQTLAMGILEPDENGEQVYNSVLLLDGEREQTYRKRHLVPFGEYFPVPDFVREWMRMMSLPNSDMRPGADEQALLVAADGTQLTAAICYEDAYGAEQLYALPDAAILVNVSNDAWFGEYDSAPPASAGCPHACARGGACRDPCHQQRHQCVHWARRAHSAGCAAVPVCDLERAGGAAIRAHALRGNRQRSAAVAAGADRRACRLARATRGRRPVLTGLCSLVPAG